MDRAIACHAPDGTFIRALDIPAPHASCPAFCGPDLQTLFVTSALQGMDAAARANAPLSGQTFTLHSGVPGQAEHSVIVDEFPVAALQRP